MTVHFPRTEFMQLRTLTERCGFVMLTNLDADGHLVSRPMTPLEVDAFGTFWFFTDWRKVSMEDLGPANLVFSEAKSHACVSVSGRCEIQVDRARIERLRERSTRLPDAEAADARNLALLKFVSARVEFWDAADDSMRHMFDHAESVRSARVIQLRPWLKRRVTPQASRPAVATAFGQIREQLEGETIASAA